ncbi:MAG: type II secretion system F family protein [Phycisphaerae bacterium]|nr:MAG: type II secretion system F family protein [Planctomycetota bacterium]KAB2944626.1 MAG: type II secretion system F family protein [Phycisphaerae bacterium]MBE7457191.1 type II secretion system F family protein [Planctomycetia bacterium]MCK6466055.1 type II secretion system F family protein [Phycisphaerae bacterium]MCL4719814.1 type II secretion system F family protein [Phycisphaerae bacterium]
MSIYMIAGLIAGSLGLIVYALWPAQKSDQETIKRRIVGRSRKDDVGEIRKRAKASVAQQVVKKFAPLAMRPVMPKSPEEMSKLRLKLANAGFRRDNAASMFLASKTIIAVLAAVVGGFFVWARGDELTKAMGIVVFCMGAGFMGPNLWLSMAAGKRAETVRNGIPDALDLMVISVESGLALDAAIQRVGDELRQVHPTLAEELQIVTLESQMGIPRAEALGNLANRTGVSEMRSLVAIINQAERFGTSIARALRTQAETLRTKRRQAAEERAQKTTVKLMAPLILFIFPAILVVLAGPAALKMIQTLKDNPAVMGQG